MTDPDLPILRELGGDLDAAFRAHERVYRWAPRRPVAGVRSALGAAIIVLLVAATAAVAFYVLRASPIAPLRPDEVSPEQRVAPGSERLLDLRARDPRPGAPPWAMRIARSQAGLICGTVGQVVDRALGVVGLDGRFRALPAVNADACGQPDEGGLVLLGARVFDADRRERVRTVINGLAGPRLEQVTVSLRGGQARTLEHTREGAFLLVARGYPEDLAPIVTLRWRGGRTRSYPLAQSPFVVSDPLGGPAWKFEVSELGRSIVRGRRVRERPSHIACARFFSARPGPDSSSSPQLCGRTGSGVPGKDRRVFFGARRLSGRTGRDSTSRGWNDHPARTAVWGRAGIETVREILITGPRRLRATVTPAVNGGFLVVLDPDVDPESLRLRVRYRNGRVLDSRPDFRLIEPPKGLMP